MWFQVVFWEFGNVSEGPAAYIFMVNNKTHVRARYLFTDRKNSVWRCECCLLLARSYSCICHAVSIPALFFREAYCWNLNMETTDSFETLVNFYQTTRCHIGLDGRLSHCAPRHPGAARDISKYCFFFEFVCFIISNGY